MIGEKKKANKLFYYLRPEELIPEDHILRLIDRYVDFSFIRPRVEHLYSYTGRPSVDPDVMMRMLLLGYLLLPWLDWAYGEIEREFGKAAA